MHTPQLIVAEKRLSRIRLEKGFFTNKRIKDAENKVKKIKEEISKLENCAYYEPPRNKDA
ncbi:MAG TPA: hypothetical protein VJ327_00765 [Patescibacteria group bacterium]|nr:hypothetical protein [Patescibacteria group bacterium]